MRVPTAFSRFQQLTMLLSLCLLPSLFATAVQAQDESATAATGAANDAMVADGEAMTTPGATKYTCSLNGLVRRVEISYGAENATVPCDVNYYKDNEAPNEVNTLWSAQNLTGYCEQKAGEFVDKLQSWGWNCNGQ